MHGRVYVDVRARSLTAYTHSIKPYTHKRLARIIDLVLVHIEYFLLALQEEDILLLVHSCARRR